MNHFDTVKTPIWTNLELANYMGCLSNSRNSLSNSPRKLVTVVAATDQGRRYTSSHVLLIVFTCFYAKFLHSPAMKDLAILLAGAQTFPATQLPSAATGFGGLVLDGFGCFLMVTPHVAIM